jgi:hypothetical protein
MKIKELKKLKEIKLSISEKRNLFDRISSSISKEDLDVKLSYPTPSPFFRFTFLFQNKHLQVGILAIFVLFITSATAFASLNSLPGDLLYNVKINIVEKIPNIFYASPESKAKDSYEKIDKRIHEFEKLAETGRLTEKNKEIVEEKIDQNFNDFDKNVREIKNKEKKTIEEKNYLESELETTLEKHTEKIRKIRENRGEDERALQSVLERVPSFHEKQNDEEDKKEKEIKKEEEQKRNEELQSIEDEIKINTEIKGEQEDIEKDIENELNLD